MNIEKCSSRSNEVCGPAPRGNIVLYCMWARADSSRRDNMGLHPHRLRRAGPRSQCSPPRAGMRHSAVHEPHAAAAVGNVLFIVRCRWKCYNMKVYFPLREKIK